MSARLAVLILENEFVGADHLFCGRRFLGRRLPECGVCRPDYRPGQDADTACQNRTRDHSAIASLLALQVRVLCSQDAPIPAPHFPTCFDSHSCLPSLPLPVRCECYTVAIRCHSLCASILPHCTYSYHGRATPSDYSVPSAPEAWPRGFSAVELPHRVASPIPQADYGALKTGLRFSSNKNSPGPDPLVVPS